VIFASLQNLVYLILFVAIFGLSVWGLVDALTRTPQAFVSAGKRTKNFWVIVLAASAAVSFVALPPPLGNGYLGFVALIAAVAAIVYLVDVRPAVKGPSGRGGRRGPTSRGGW